MSYKRKYRKGEPITSLDELEKQEFIYFLDKIIHRGWFGSWQFRLVKSYIDRGYLYNAIKNVQEVKHGEWEYIGTDKMGNVFRCSQCCGRIGLDKETDYCPNCGARMDGEDNG